ncbi:MAG: phosphodiester glycosidase family protein [Candidatus Berkiella sp.]
MALEGTTSSGPEKTGYTDPQKATVVGEGIVSTLIATRKPSELFGDEGRPLDLNKLHEVMVTRIDPSKVSLVLTTNQGTPDALMRHLHDCKASYGAIINGGFYALDEGFYHLKSNQPIGLHRFTYNYSQAHHKDVIKRNFDNTDHYFKYSDDQLSKSYEGYSKKGIPSELHLKTQTPNSVRELYGCFRITSGGEIDIQKLGDFTDETFKDYLKEAQYLLSSGPFLVTGGEVAITADDIQADPRFQFKQIYDRFGSHPGSVPPGTFYHADQLNPRSAIGITAEGELLMVTVKGEEDPSHRDGMTLDQFALLMKLLGAHTALNLDGGYSSCQGFFDKTNPQMFTPQFIKKPGREKLLPCAIVAKEKTDILPLNHHRDPLTDRGPKVENVKRKFSFIDGT